MNDLTGKPAVPFHLRDSNGCFHRLEDYRGRWLLLVFHRHLGWLPCRAHITQLRDQEERFRRHNLSIAVVTFEHDFLARAYVEDTALPWPLLVDETREVYRDYGMLSASFRDVWGPGTWWACLKEILRGGKLRKSGGDLYQRGGDVLIDPSGIVVLHHVGAGPADRPAVGTILRKIAPA